MNEIDYKSEIMIDENKITIKHEYIRAEEYIEFLSRTDLGKQYPKEDFLNRIKTLLQNIDISLVARNRDKIIIGICLGLTDFAYWLLVTDLGIDRKYEKRGLGKKLMETVHELAGGENKIIQFAYANENAIEFYGKIGMRKSNDMMEKVNIEWTEFEVGKDLI
jgi:GNAT superfamily N-acetyltransferase